MAIAAGYLACATSVFAQAGYLSRDPNVAVDMSVLEELGSPATVAGPSVQSTISTPSGLAFPPPAPPVSRLTGALANRPLLSAPPLRKQASTLTHPSVVPPAPVIVESTPPVVPAPPAKVEVQVAAPPPPPPPPVAPAPEPKEAAAPPPPPPPPVAPPPEPKEAAAPTPPEPSPALEPAPSPEPVQTTAPPTEERPAAAEPPATPTLTPSPAGAAPQPAAPTQTASTPQIDGLPPAFRVLFDDKSATISDAAHGQLDELTAAMKQNEGVRVQLLAYAGGAAGTASQARRLSLSRALAVRSYLINQGVRSTRMDVRALGNQTEGGPADRVDAVIIER